MSKTVVKNFNGTQINNSETITEAAGAAIEDVRNRIVKYDENGDVVLASAATDIPVGVALIEAGVNDITGQLSGSVEKGDDVDILIKDIGYVIAGAEIKKGAEVTSDKDGLATTAASGNYVLGIALDSAAVGEYVRVQITKYQKA